MDFGFRSFNMRVVHAIDSFYSCSASFKKVHFVYAEMETSMSLSINPTRNLKRLFSI